MYKVLLFKLITIYAKGPLICATKMLTESELPLSSQTLNFLHNDMLKWCQHQLLYSVCHAIKLIANL